MLLKPKPIGAEEVYVDILRIDNIAVLPVLDKDVVLLIIADPSIEVGGARRDLNRGSLYAFGTRRG